MNDSNKMRDIYINSGLTYKKIAELTDIKENTIACWITGKRQPPTYVINYVNERINSYLNKNKYDDECDEFIQQTKNLIHDDKISNEIISSFNKIIGKD